MVLIATQNATGNNPPAIIKSAFKFKDGSRIIVYTGSDGIVSYQCDDNWGHFNKPFATCPIEMITEGFVKYHEEIRRLHDAESFVPEHSTDITPYLSEEMKHIETAEEILAKYRSTKYDAVHNNYTVLKAMQEYATQQTAVKDNLIKEMTEALELCAKYFNIGGDPVHLTQPNMFTKVSEALQKAKSIQP